MERLKNKMGMYNEVKCICPNCRECNVIQTSQYVLGFGNFSLLDLTTFEVLSKEDLRNIKEELNRNIYCDNCRSLFNPIETYKDRTLEIKNILFGE